MERDSLKLKVASSMFWKFGERVGTRFVTFVVSLLLARILSPEDYGIVALLTFFVSVLDVIITSGFGSSLVQRKDASDLDFSTVFYFCVLLSCVLYLLLFFCAPIIARFFSNNTLIMLLRILGIRLLFSGVATIQNAYVDKHMMFKRYFISSTFSAIISGSVAYLMALYGYGVWSLVAQYVISLFISTVVLWFTVRWRPVVQFSTQRLKLHYSYGWKLLMSSIIATVYTEVRAPIIGRLYSSSALGYYSRGNSFPNLITDNLTSSINSVLFPAISQEQTNPDKVRSMTRRSIKTTAYLIMPIMTGMAVVAKPLVLLLLTNKWIESVPYLQIACFSGALGPIQSANLQAIKALGYSDVILKLETIKRILGILTLIIVMRYGVLAIAISSMFSSALFLFINTYPNKKLLNYTIKEQMIDILPFVGMCLVMASVVYPIQLLDWPIILILSIQVLIGALLYFVMSGIFKVDSLEYLRTTIISLFKRSANSKLDVI